MAIKPNFRFTSHVHVYSKISKSHFPGRMSKIEFDLFLFKETLMQGWIVAWQFQPQLPSADTFTAPPVDTSKPSQSGLPCLYLHNV